MKSKYMSRKFIIALAGIALAIGGVVYANQLAVFCGSFLGACFIIGEAVIDANSATKRQVKVIDCKNYEVGDGSKDNS